MANQLLNSMVRGFGFTLGRKAADSITRPAKVSNTEMKRLSIINEYQVGINKYKEILQSTKESYQNSKITKAEYDNLESQCLIAIEDLEGQITQLQGVKTEKGGCGLLVFFGIIIVIYALLWIGKVI